MVDEPRTQRDKLAFQMKEAARASGICKAKLYQEIRAGRLKSVKVAGRRLILRDDLEAFLRARQAALKRHRRPGRHPAAAASKSRRRAS